MRLRNGLLASFMMNFLFEYGLLQAWYTLRGLDEEYIIFASEFSHFTLLIFVVKTPQFISLQKRDIWSLDKLSW